MRKISQMPKAINADESKFTVSVNGNKYHIEVQAGFDKSVNIKSVSKVQPANSSDTAQNATNSASDENADSIKASISGNVFKTLIAKGDTVKAGQVVFVLEAMKMEIEVSAPKDGTISEICVQTADTVSEGQNLALYK